MRRLRISLSLALATACLLVANSTAQSDDPVAPDSLQQQHERANQEVDRLLAEYQTLQSAEGVEGNQLSQTRANALAAITEALDLELLVREERIEEARLRLDAVEAKLKLSRKVLSRLASQRLNAKLAELKASDAKRYASPQAVLDQMNVCAENKDMAGLVELLTDEASRDLASTMLISAAGISIMGQFAESTVAAAAPAGDEIQAMRAMDQLVAEAALENPPPEATKAYKELMQIYVAALFSQPQPTALPTAADPIRTAAGILKDHRRFIVDASLAIERLTGSSIFMQSEDDVPLQWNVSIDGDVAIAVVAEPPEGSLASEMELRRIDGGWKISRMMSDEMLKKAADGPSFSFQPAVTSSPRNGAVLPPSSSPSSTAEATPIYPGAPPNPAMESPLGSFSPPPGPMPPPGSVGLLSGSVGPPPGSVGPPPGSVGSVDPPRDEFAPPSRLPVYSGQEIGYWLQKYWDAVTTRKPYGSSLNAIKVLRDQPSSDPYIRHYLSQWFSKIEDELDTSYLALVANCIVTVAGPRHQEQTVDYLFRIADQNPGKSYDPGTGRSLEQAYFLRGTILELQRRDGQLASQIAAKLTNGTTKERELAIAILLIPSERNDVPSTGGEKEAWTLEHQSILKPALVAATRDSDETIRSLALSLLGSVAPDSSEFNSRLPEMMESDPSVGVRTLTLMHLASARPDDELVHKTVLDWARSGERELVAAALQVMYPSDTEGGRTQSVDELIELLKEPTWGSDGQHERDFGEMYKSTRQYAIALLGHHGSNATRALPVLEVEVARGNDATLKVAKEAIDRIAGFSASLPVEKLKGLWRPVAMDLPSDQSPILSFIPDSGDESLVRIDGTKVWNHGKLIARISRARGSSEEIVRVLSDPEGRKKHCTGAYRLSGDNLVFEVYEVRPAVEAAGGLPSFNDEPQKQRYQFRRVDPTAEIK